MVAAPFMMKGTKNLCADTRAQRASFCKSFTRFGSLSRKELLGGNSAAIPPPTARRNVRMKIDNCKMKRRAMNDETLKWEMGDVEECLRKFRKCDYVRE